jgi:ectoine hydroxylase-related dioxygenase (phytanoyl-CoA dioxygenase family)
MRTTDEDTAIPSLARRFSSNGYIVISNVLGSDKVASTLRQLAGVDDNTAGIRTLLEMPWCLRLADGLCSDSGVRSLLPSPAHLVQCTLFAKVHANNWLVSLHQDLSIPVAERVESTECRGWSQKEGQIFVQPPVSVLQELVAVRLYLDDCDARNGALRVVPGSHCLGRFTSAGAQHARDVRGETSVPVPRGGVMIMRPLLLHASSKASIDLPRRVLHYVFGPKMLPEGLRWPDRSEADVGK